MEKSALKSARGDSAVHASATAAVDDSSDDVAIPSSERKPRNHALADPRNSYTEAVMFKAFQSDIESCLILNFDETQYYCEPSLPRRGDDHSAGESYSSDSESEENDEISSAALGAERVYLKSFTLMSAAGYVGPMVLMLANDRMREEELVTVELVGVSHSSSMDSVGYVVFTKTLRGNSAFYSWYLKSIICKYVDTVRSISSPPGSYAFVSCNGEPPQIPAFLEESNIQLLDQHRIYLAKHADLGGAAQAGGYFRATKTEMKRGTNPLWLSRVGSRVLDEELQKVCSHFTPSTRKAILWAVASVLWACQNTCNMTFLGGGFRKTGQYNPMIRGMDFDKKMRYCTTKIPEAQLEIMRNALPRLAEVFRAKGYLSEQDMDEAGIMKVGDEIGKPRDRRVLHKNRSLVLNTPANIARFRDSITKKTSNSKRKREVETEDA
jgi:hypothetical protein